MWKESCYQLRDENKEAMYYAMQLYKYIYIVAILCQRSYSLQVPIR